MIVPYRSKNPPEQFPNATICLIALNVLVYLVTTNFLLEIKPGIVADFGVSPEYFNPLRLLVSMFLHAEPVHLIVNMWFLWLFGAAVEGRLSSPKYVALYVVSGLGAGIVQCLVEKGVGARTLGYGADGAVFGIAGAYIYLFPFARIMVFRLIIISLSYMYIGPAEWLAWWVVVFYVGADVFNGVIANMMGLSDVFSYIAHVGGILFGFAIAMACRAKRDSEYRSQVQSVRADLGGDISLLALSELENMVESSTDDMDIVIAYCNKVMIERSERGEQSALKAINQYKQPLLLSADADRLARIVLGIRKEHGGVSGPFYLRLGSKLEQEHSYERAANTYRRAYDLYQATPDGGAALMRLARMWEFHFFTPQLAQEAYTVYAEHYPTGALTEEAHKGLARVNKILGGSKEGRLPSLQSELKSETEFVLHSDTDETGSVNKRVTAVPDFNDTPGTTIAKKNPPNR